MNTLYKQLSTMGIVPVIALPSVESALPLAKALKNGGLPCMEITFRTEACLEGIRTITKEHPDIIVGAGTVLTTDAADAAVAAGAQFIVTPGLNPQVLHHCVDRGYPIIPGCSNPGDVEQAMACGLKVVKLFPAEAVGGLKLIDAMAGPYGDMRFFPTGGINPGNVTAYLKNPHILCCGGTWMVPQDALAKGDYNTIEALTRQAVATILNYRITQVEIAPGEDANASTQSLCDILGFTCSSPTSDGSTPPKGQDKGQLTIATTAILPAVGHLERRGFSLDWESATYNAKGRLVAIPIMATLGGFGLTLMAQ